MMVTTSLTIGGMGLVCGIALALAARFLATKEDRRIEQVLDILPGGNCGGCAYVGCAEYAKAVILDGASIDLCLPGGSEVIEKLAALTGMAAGKLERKVTVVLCGGDSTQAPRKFIYNGIADCAAANAVGGGDKVCGYGCLGYGTCARVCPVGAIAIRKSLAVVHPEICIGCGACVNACPRNLIKLVPASRSIHVLCNSKDKEPVIEKACKVGCIGCTLCTKLADNEAIKMSGPLAVVDYCTLLENEAVVGKCPTHCIVKRKAAA